MPERDWTTAEHYPFAVDLARERALIVPMALRDYRNATFLDERMLQRRAGEWADFSYLQAVSDSLVPKPLHFIFHIGHTGSTLLSRVLDEAGPVLGLREPLPLRSFAEAFDFAHGTAALEVPLQIFQRLWSRGFDTTETIILKATSSAARIAPHLLAARPETHAIYLHLRSEPYLAALLAGANNAGDLNAHGPERLFRLRRMLGDAALPQPAGLGELAAMSWLCEMLTRRAVLDRFGEQILAIDFDNFLQEPQHHLARILERLCLAGDAKALARSGAFTRYSKAPEHTYSPQLRSAILKDARTAYGDEIRRGRNWLSALAGRHMAVCAVMDED